MSPSHSIIRPVSAVTNKLSFVSSSGNPKNESKMSGFLITEVPAEPIKTKRILIFSERGSLNSQRNMTNNCTFTESELLKLKHARNSDMKAKSQVQEERIVLTCKKFCINGKIILNSVFFK